VSYVAWKDDLATGFEDIDNDHKVLFDLVDQFHEVYAGSGNDAQLKMVFDALMDYTDYHFRREEAFMEEKGYPHRAAHQKLHKALKEEINKLHERFRKGELKDGETDLGLEILAFLNNWLRFHITEEDMMYRDFINAGEKA
jgi:hemerythrin